MTGSSMTHANLGLGAAWVALNVAIVVWSHVARPGILMVLRVQRISCVLCGAAAALLACIGFRLGLVTAPVTDVVAAAGCLGMIRLNLALRRWVLRFLELPANPNEAR